MAKSIGKAIIFDNVQNTCETAAIQEISDVAILTDRGMYQLEDCVQRLDTTSRQLLYLVNADIPAKVEAMNLVRLRRSEAIKAMMKFNIKDKPDYFKYVPYVIIALLILFK